jgi:hypothetical protein
MKRSAVVEISIGLLIVYFMIAIVIFYYTPIYMGLFLTLGGLLLGAILIGHGTIKGIKIH